MATIPLATVACSISATGITAPTYSDILATKIAQYQAIYGSDISLDPSTQDYQWLAIEAAAQNDTNAVTIATFLSFSPSTAQGAALASLVKINGLQKLVPTNSSVDLTIIGQAGTQIVNGIAGDENGNQWLMTDYVTIPLSGVIVTTALALDVGAVTAGAGTVTSIVTPTLGWQSVNNVAAAVAGAPVETDAALRVRQAASTDLAALTPLQSIVAAVTSLPGVLAVQPYENDTKTTDANGVPGNSICLVVSGGDAVQIATAIASKKIPGGGTYGSTSEVIIDPSGVPNTISFSRPIVERMIVGVVLTPLTGFVSTTEPLVQAALAAWVNALPIGGDVVLNDLVAAAKLPAPLGATYKIEYGALTASLFGTSLGTADIVITYNQDATLAISDVALTVTS